LKSVNWQIKGVSLSSFCGLCSSVAKNRKKPQAKRPRPFWSVYHKTNGGVIILDYGFQSLITNQDLTRGSKPWKSTGEPTGSQANWTLALCRL
jgi:hypothetical protein